jgi:hypothetical protein
MRTREELAWAAGLFEGEGTVSYNATAIFMCDEDRLRAFRQALGFGTVGPHTKRRNQRQPQYKWYAQSFEGVQATAALLWEWLGPRRRAQFKRFLEYRQRPRRTHRRTRGLTVSLAHELFGKRYCELSGTELREYKRVAGYQSYHYRVGHAA